MIWFDSIKICIYKKHWGKLLGSSHLVQANVLFEKNEIVISLVSYLKSEGIKVNWIFLFLDRSSTLDEGKENRRVESMRAKVLQYCYYDNHSHLLTKTNIWSLRLPPQTVFNLFKCFFLRWHHIYFGLWCEIPSFKTFIIKISVFDLNLGCGRKSNLRFESGSFKAFVIELFSSEFLYLC